MLLTQAPALRAQTWHSPAVPKPSSFKLYKMSLWGIKWVDSTGYRNTTSSYFVRRVCKGGFTGVPMTTWVKAQPDSEQKKSIPIAVAKQHRNLLKVKGDILYDVNYRSRIDTPYAENNVYQHYLQTRLDIVYKDRYPVRVYVTTHFSNSLLLRNYTDLNFQFNPNDFKRMIKSRLISEVERRIALGTGELDSLYKKIQDEKSKIASLRQTLLNPDIAQKIVEEREKKIFEKKRGESINNIPANGMDGITNKHDNDEFGFAGNKENISKRTQSAEKSMESFETEMENKKKKLDSMTSTLAELEKKYKEIKSVQQYKLKEFSNELEHIKDASALKQKLHQLNLPDSLLPKGYKTLSSIQSFSLGRSTLNYSELSVKNISITGIQVEYSPKNYYAFAAGRVDYRFRDYIISSRVHSNQYVVLGRIGKLTKNGNRIAFTYYTGRRQLFNASVTSQPNAKIPEYNLAGMTLEGTFKPSRNILLVGEVAKSTVPYYSLDSNKRKNWMNSVTKFNDRSNEAYSLQLVSFFPKTHTRVNASVRYIGANFQSFSTFTTGASQLRWISKLEQEFFKRQLTVVSSVQQNDYNNPFVTTSYKSSSLLTSFQVNVRIKKWPYISVGYYPSYQLIKAGDSHYIENRYYTIMGSMAYYYTIQNTHFSSYAMYSRFYNSMSDSGFVYFNSKNYFFNQNISFGKFSTALNVSLSYGTDYNIYTLENSSQITVNKILTIGGGVKKIRYSLLNKDQWGYNGSMTLRIPKLGDIQFRMDKGFIPGVNRQLVEDKVGRLTYYKIF